MKITLISISFFLLGTLITHASEFHVAINGDDTNSGTNNAPLRSIQRAADLAQPGDVITVHEGVYRERINPPRGGTSDQERIVYQAAPGAKVAIKGSEVVKGWEKVEGDVWKVIIPNNYFGDFNPYSDVIRGDWFNGRGRQHHTGAVYLNGDWLTEAASLDEVMLPAGQKPAWLAGGNQEYLINLAWFALDEGIEENARIPAAGYSGLYGIQTAACSEGGECIGWIEHGDWVRYGPLDFGKKTQEITFRAASPGNGGLIEIRLDGPDGDLLGTCLVKGTGDWQTWQSFETEIKPISGFQTICLVFKDPEAKDTESNPLNQQLWFARVDDANTTIWAQFHHTDPNGQLVEINVRQTVFYPDQPGRNYITIRGFTMQHAATPWAPPTAEQIGLIGTHWSKGWIIENNIISHSVCSGIALGKHGDEYDNTSADTAEGYVETIKRAHAFPIPWTRETIGGHIVRNNTIAYCEQAGVVGSMGAAFSTVEDNIIHDIHVRRLFTGAEMAGIKFHAAIDSTIRRNHIYRTTRGLWLDWMTQGTRVSRNLFHDNITEDLFVEVNHGPFLVDNNIFLSQVSLLDMSEGGAYVHNLFTGRIVNRPEPSRETPYHPAHSTKVAGLAITTGSDNRFYNNIFVGDGQVPTEQQKGNLEEIRWISSYGLWGYDGRTFPLYAGGNAYLNGAQPSVRETDPVVIPTVNPEFELVEEDGNFYLHFTLPQSLNDAATRLVTTSMLGLAKVPQLPYVNPDGSPIEVDADYFGKRRDPSNPMPGPFSSPGKAAAALRVR